MNVLSFVIRIFVVPATPVLAAQELARSAEPVLAFVRALRMEMALVTMLLCACIGPAAAADHQVRMLNQGMDSMMQFDPQLLKIAPGDTVHFTATDQGHNVQSLDGMIPDGAKPFHSEIGQNLTVTFTVPGIYGYRCTPHGTLGMVGLIVVGQPANEAAAKASAMGGAAGRVFAKLFQSLDSPKTAGN